MNLIKPYDRRLACLGRGRIYPTRFLLRVRCLPVRVPVYRAGTGRRTQTGIEPLQLNDKIIYFL